MPLDDLDSPSNYTQRMRWADFEDPNEFAESRDRHDKHRLRSASMAAALERLQPRSAQRQQARVEDIEDQQNEAYDLEYVEPGMERLRGGITGIKGDIARREGGRNAEQEQSNYFNQRPMREDKEAASLRALKSRYTDPAMIKAEADIRREAARGSAARDVAGITGGSRERQEATQQFGGVTRDQVLSGDRAAGETGRAQLQGRMGAPDKTAQIGGPRGLQAYADAQGISLDEAIAAAERMGYAVVD